MLHKPKLSESEASELLLDSYVMHIHNNRCKNCDCVERHSHLFEVWTHPTKTRLTALNVLKPVMGALQPLPIAYIDLPEREVPICSDCVELYTPPTGTPLLPAADPAAWRETLRKKYTPQPVADSRQPETKKEPTLDQL